MTTFLGSWIYSAKNWSRWFVCTTCGGVRKHSWPLLTQASTLISFFSFIFSMHCFSPTSGLPGSWLLACHLILNQLEEICKNLWYLLSPMFFSFWFYGQHSVAAAWTNPSPWNIGEYFGCYHLRVKSLIDRAYKFRWIKSEFIDFS